MKGREGKGPPSTDLLVCFPSRAHLTLMPKPICSPARPSEPNKRQHNHNHHQHHHHSSHHHPPPHHHHHNHHHHLIKKSSNRNGVAGQASPILWAKNKPMSKEIDEPTSPKVTCAGQIKVKPKASSCKNWQSVMEEIERLHNKSKHKKRPTWVEALGFKKDVMQFLTCLRSIRFDFRCFGAFPSTAITSDDEDDVDEDDDEYHQDHPHHQNNHLGREASDDHDSDNTSRTVFSKWFMVLQENNTSNKSELVKTDNKLIKDEATEAPCAPPPNALLLMRCRSAPAKSWLEVKEEEEEDEEEEIHDDEEEDEKQRKDEEDEKRIKLLAMEEEKKRNDNLVVMRCGSADFYKFSSDIAKETWVVGGIKDSLSRSRSWKR